MGIMFSLENHVKSLKNPLTPSVFKEQARLTITNATKVLHKMDKNSNTSDNAKHINYLQAALAEGEGS